MAIQREPLQRDNHRTESHTYAFNAPYDRKDCELVTKSGQAASRCPVRVI